MGITVLGPLGVEGGVALSPRDRVVLAALSAQLGRPVGADQLADALWPGRPPASAAKVVQGCVVRLRKVLGADAIETTPHGYRLALAPDDVDALRFERLVVRGRELLALGEADRAAYLLADALSLWQGDPYPELADWETGAVEAERLAQLRLDAEELHLEASLRAGRHREVIGEAQRMVAAAPMRERRWALLATAQYQNGRQGEALRTLHQVKSMLVEQLGIDPSPELAALEQAILRQDSALLVDGSPTASAAHCPYPGLKPYDVDDAESFFGRDADLDTCREILRRTSTLAIVGPSGSGKSSLLRAGIAAGLRRDGRRVVTITPGPHPMDALTALPESGPPAALVVDQCEEVFSLCTDPVEQGAFVQALTRHATTAPVALALRADRLADVAGHPQLSRLVERSLHLLGGLGADGLREAIERPARQVGLMIEPGLVDLLVREVEDQPGALPLLSHALVETWRRREGNTLTVAGYQASGGIKDAVARTAEHVYASVPTEQRPALRELLLRLVSPGAEGEPVRSRVSRRTVASDAEHDRLVDMLVSARLVTSDQGIVEISHEALARAWPRLRAWLDDDVEGQRILHHLSAAADGWDALGRPDSELYRGVRLARAVDWSSRSTLTLTPTERDFLAASKRLAEAEERSAAERARVQARLIRRLRIVLAGAVGLLVLALVAGALAVRQADRADAEARDADASAAAAAQAARVADARRVAAAALITDDIDESMLLAVAGVQLDESADTRSALTSVLNERPALIASTRSVGDEVVDVDIGPRGMIATYDLQHTVRLHDPVSGDVTASYQAGVRAPAWGEYPFRAVEFSPDGRTLAVLRGVTSREPVTLLDVPSLEPLAQQPLTGLGWRWKASEADFSGDGRVLAVAAERMTGDPEALELTSSWALVWDLGDTDKPRMIALAPGQPSVALNRDGSRLYAADPLAVHDLTSGRERTIPLEGFGQVEDVVLSPDDTLLAVTNGHADETAGGDGGATGSDAEVEEVRLIDARSGELIHRLTGLGPVYAARFSDDGERLAFAPFHERAAVIIDVTTGAEVARMDLPDDGGAVALAPDGETLVTGGIDGALRTWDLVGDQRFVADIALGDAARYGGFVNPAPGGGFVAYTPFEEPTTLAFVDVRRRTATDWIQRPAGGVNGGGSWHRDGRTYAIGTGRTISVYDAGTGAVLDEAQMPGFIGEVDYSPDGTRLAVAEMTAGRISLLDAASLEPVSAPVDVDGRVCCIALGPDNRTAIAILGGIQESAYWLPRSTGWAIVDLETGTVDKSGQLGMQLGIWAAMSPDGRRAAIGGWHGELLLLDVETGQRVRLVEQAHGRDSVNWITFSPDGSTLLTGGANGTLALWDAETGELRNRVRYDDFLASGEFLPDGRSVLISTWNGQLQIWDPSTERAIQAACSVAGRDFTRAEWTEIFGDRPYQETCPQ